LPSPLGFPKEVRLLKRPDFLAVKAGGLGFAEGPLAASWRFRDRPPARIGITVSSQVGNAVTRNRVKRLLREAVRHERAGLPQVDLVIVARASSTQAKLADFRGWIRRAIPRMRRK
jgi:ribonuclease P protein component